MPVLHGLMSLTGAGDITPDGILNLALRPDGDSPSYTITKNYFTLLQNAGSEHLSHDFVPDPINAVESFSNALAHRGTAEVVVAPS